MHSPSAQSSCWCLSCVECVEWSVVVGKIWCDKCHLACSDRFCDCAVCVHKSKCKCSPTLQGTPALLPSDWLVWPPVVRRARRPRRSSCHSFLPKMRCRKEPPCFRCRRVIVFRDFLDFVQTACNNPGVVFSLFPLFPSPTLLASTIHHPLIFPNLNALSS